jgi:murein DD-endopeptidase MepM/ murein hydrolase activator NlpD
MSGKGATWIVASKSPQEAGIKAGVVYGPGAFRRFLLVVLVCIIGVCGFAYKQQDDVQVTCGPFASAVPMVKLLDGAYKLGQIQHRLSTPGGAPTYWQTYKAVRGTLGTSKLLWAEFWDGWQGKPSSTFSTGIRLDAKQAQDDALKSCCPQPTVDDPPEQGGGEENGPAPFNPKDLSIRGVSTSTNLTGKYLAADALHAAGIPVQEIPTFVAIGHFESTDGRDLENSSNPHVKGWWQLDQRYWKTGDWHNVYDNAKAVKKARDEGMEKFGDPYHHWSTRNAAKRAAHSYEDLTGAMPKGGSSNGGGGNPSGPSVEVNPPTTGDGDDAQNPNVNPWCAPSAGTGELNSTVGTWNVLMTNSQANVASGLREMRAKGADVIGLQELGDEQLRASAARAVPNMTMIDKGNAVPILYDNDKYRVLDFDDELVLADNTMVEPRGDDHGSVGPKFMTWAHLEDRNTGRRFYVLNTHMLVGPQVGPKRRAAYNSQLQKVLGYASQFEQTGDPVVITGDWNGEKVPAMTAAGMVSSLTKATLGDKTYDRVWSKGATPTTHLVLGKNGSDHKPVIATFVAASISEGSSGTSELTNSKRVIWPVPGHTVAPDYQGHDGADLNRGSQNDDCGDTIQAPVSMTIIYVGWGRGYGHLIQAKTDIGGYTLFFGHTSAQTVTVGQHVEAGTKIGEVGNTYKKRTIYCHLHFGVKPGMTRKAALNFLEGKAKGFEVGGSDSQLVSQPAGHGNPYSPRARYVQKIATAKWGCKAKASPCVPSIGGYVNKNIAGTDVKSDHATGNADDIMLQDGGAGSANRALGKEIAEYMVANYQVLNVKYVIFDIDGKGGPNIWSAARKREGWRNGGVGPHQNHVHVSVESGTAA